MAAAPAPPAPFGLPAGHPLHGSAAALARRRPALTAALLLAAAPAQLAAADAADPAQIAALQRAVAAHVLAGGSRQHAARGRRRRLPCAALQLRQRRRPFARLPTGCAALDAVLRGGLPVGALVEVAGVAGAGKTQLTMQLALEAQRAPLSGRAIILYSEGATYPTGRLQQLAARYAGAGGDAATWMDRISLHHVANSAMLQELLHERLPRFLQAPTDAPVRLIVLDSIAALVRTEYDYAESSDRAALLFGLARAMKRLADTHDLVFLVVNQMTQPPSRDELPARAVAALGMAWAACVSHRLVLTREGSRREMSVALSSGIPCGERASFSITMDGVVGGD